MFTKRFDNYVCEGDSISCEVEGVLYRATIERDPDTDIREFDCYGPDEIESWRNDEWWFGVMRISARKGTVDLGDSLVSLHGIDVHPGEDEYGCAQYLLDVANELLPEAMRAGADRVEEIKHELGVE